MNTNDMLLDEIKSAVDGKLKMIDSLISVYRKLLSKELTLGYKLTQAEIDDAYSSEVMMPGMPASLESTINFSEEIKKLIERKSTIINARSHNG